MPVESVVASAMVLKLVLSELTASRVCQVPVGDVETEIPLKTAPVEASVATAAEI